MSWTAVPRYHSFDAIFSLLLLSSNMLPVISLFHFRHQAPSPLSQKRQLLPICNILVLSSFPCSYPGASFLITYVSLPRCSHSSSIQIVSSDGRSHFGQSSHSQTLSGGLFFLLSLSFFFFFVSFHLDTKLFLIYSFIVLDIRSKIYDPVTADFHTVVHPLRHCIHVPR